MQGRECSAAFRQMTALAAIGASGRKADVPKADWPEVLRCAASQDVRELLACSLIVQPEHDCPPQISTPLMEMLRVRSGSNEVRMARVLRLIDSMTSAGLDVQLLKGAAVAACYRFPESRRAADTDLLIPPQQEEKACAFLREKGFRVDMRGRTGHHDVAWHADVGVVEVHVHLYSELRRENWFRLESGESLRTESTAQVILSGKPYATLGATDHLIFLTLHLAEHFISGGMGLRMMLDIALFFVRHREEIDAARYWRVLDALRLGTLVRCCLWAMIDTGCFARGDFPGLAGERPPGVEALLFDLEQGGHMGIRGSERADSAYEYNRQVFMRTRSPMEYRLYMLRQKIRDAEKQMFPDREHLLQYDPSLVRKKWRIPFARVHRMIAYPLGKLRAGALRRQLCTDAKSLPEEARRRVEMFRELGMF